MDRITGNAVPARGRSLAALGILLAIAVASVMTASRAQRDFGRVEVSDAYYKNYNGIPIRAKLFRPVEATDKNPLPGVVYIHGYQNNRETGDAYSIEVSRRGFVVLNIDAIGRGRSGNPGDPAEPGFDPTYGGKSSIEYLRSLPFVKASSAGIMGHSLGAEMAYNVALKDPSVRALVITGFAYTADATPAMPKNMLMIIGKYDEFRGRMTGVRDIGKEWMRTERTAKAIAVKNPALGTTYGDFAKGTARRVVVPPITHVHESHNGEAIAETVLWLKQALGPPEKLWVDPADQVWHIKEYATLAAMLACIALLLPLGALLLRVPFFRPLAGAFSWDYSCGAGDYLKFSSINGVLLWLYIPLILTIFGIHKFAVRIDKAFPMMMVNALVWWFLWVNIIGLLLFRRWFKKRSAAGDLTLHDLGVSFDIHGLRLDWNLLARTFAFSLILFAAMYALELLSEALCIVNFRFVWPFFSALTAYRVKMMVLYWPFILFCFIVAGMFLHGQIRRAPRATVGGTFLAWSGYNIAALCVPLILLLMVQYVPLFINGLIIFAGPGGLFSVFMISLVHVVMLLAITSVVSTWMYIITGKIYAGAFLNSLLIAWAFASSQVIAPIPV